MLGGPENEVCIVAGSELTNKKILDQTISLNNRLVAALNYCFEDIIITDGKGMVLFASKSCENFYGAKIQDLLGKNVHDLEKQGFFHPSVTVEVLRQKKEITLTQTTKQNKKIFVTAYPVFNKTGEIDSIVLVSRDITEMDILNRKLSELEELSRMYLSEIQRLKNEQISSQQIIVESDQMKEILRMVNKIAQVDSIVLIQGESGVGKGIIASRIHQLSKRFKKPFVSVNCGAIPENLVESELFGYEPGAFTGALKQGKKGLFETAENGTIFLDEITEIPLNIQVKLLHIIQFRHFRRVGGNNDINVNVRIISATNQNMERLVQQGKFREDLYYRLNVIPLRIPPLRQRRDDIGPMIESFVKHLNEEYRLKKEVSSETVELLKKYDWPGNVRELENFIERVLVTTDNSSIEPYHLPDYILYSGNTNQIAVMGICSLKEATEEMERQLIKRAYEKYQNTYKIAEALQIDQSTAARKIKKYLGNSVSLPPGRKPKTLEI